MKLTQDDANNVAKMVVNAYLPYKSNDFTVVSSIFSVSNIENDIQLESLATGVKCYPGSSDIVRDCHAEVLSRRAFVHKYINSIEKPKEVGLFCSSLPCGMFSIESFNNHSNPPLHDRIIPTIYGNVCRGREFSNLKQYPRTKPGKRQAKVLLNMSCSDKILKWLFVGIQGKRIPDKVELKYLICNQPISSAVLEFLSINFPKLIVYATNIPMCNSMTHPSSIAMWTDFKDTEHLSNGRKQGSKEIKDSHGVLIPKIQSKLTRYHLNILNKNQNAIYLSQLHLFKQWRKGWTHSH